MLSDYIAWCIIVKPAHLKPRLSTAIWLSAQNFLDWPIGNFKEVYKILMNFSLVKKCKKFKPSPWACYAIITEYVGLFFILSNCSIQSTFLLFCKILVCVVSLRQTIHRTEAHYLDNLDNIFTLESTLSRIFLLGFDFFFFLISCSVQQYSRLYFPFIYEGTEICLNFKFCEKRGNTDLRAGAKLTT